MKKSHPELSPTVMNERMLARLRLRHLRLVVALGTTATLHKAAEAVGISQPAATQMLREMEELLALQLFERHSRGMRPTAAGRVLADHGRSVLESLRTATGTMAALAAGASGLLRIGGTPAALTGLLEPVIGAFHRQHPDLQLEVVEDSSERLLAGLTGGALHLILVRQSTPVPEGLRFEALRRDRAVLVASCRHPAAALARVRLRDLAEERWILPPVEFPIRRLFDTLFEKARMQPQVYAVQTTSPVVLPTLLQAGGVVAPMPLSVVGPGLQERGLVMLRLDPKLGLELEALGAIFRPEGLGTAARSLLEALREASLGAGGS
ncbi:LysR family transcriptional regulator [Variovorax terrae]|uniref:LysR family transcriptional regulator n=1 Tax=Variovorax terrae TaxID=2923278 RepID=A0A9X1W1G6_9BURK|nr:LysR family transcriptional regulator [Variovorax terrae]MCJ0764393.1 LysR family transcriptional regulator [Variovorax terrae]